MLNKIYLFVFILIISSMVIVIAQDEGTFVVTKSQNPISSNSVNQNSMNKFSTQSFNQIKVNFITNPTNSELFVNNIDYGKTPTSIYLNPGSYQIKISKSGYFTSSFSIQINSGYEYTYTVHMYPGSGTPNPFYSALRISNYYPQGLDVVFITDVSGGSGNYRFNWNFGDGSYQVTSSNNVFHTFPHSGTFTTTVRVDDLVTGHNSISFRQFILSKTSNNTSYNRTNSTIKFTSNPTNANLFINGVNYGQTPKSVSLNPGKYYGVMSLPGYYNNSFYFTIKAGYIYNILVNLKHSVNNSYSGVNGVITYGPITPVCQINTPCYSPFYGSIVIEDQSKTRVVANSYTNKNGQYNLRLLPGNYFLLVNRNFITTCGKNFNVVSNMYTNVNLTCDTGIR